MAETNVMYFTPYAWSKMLFLRDKSKNEVSGFGVTPRHYNLIEDIAVPKQEVQAAYVDIDDTGLAIMCDELAQKGLQPADFMRIWIHTHPAGCGATPSGRDEQCMRDSFSTPDWACMMIISQNGQSSCRMQVNKPFTMTKELKIETHFGYDFPASDRAGWEKEYEEKVKQKTYVQQYVYGNGSGYTSGHTTPSTGFYPTFDEKEILAYKPGQKPNASGAGLQTHGGTKKLALEAGYSLEVAEHIAFIAFYYFDKTALAYNHIEKGIKACIIPKEQSGSLIREAIAGAPTAQEKPLASLMAHVLNVIMPTAKITMGDIFMIAGNTNAGMSEKAKRREDKKKEKNLQLQKEDDVTGWWGSKEEYEASLRECIS